jgi:hypothetical protein
MADTHDDNTGWTAFFTYVKRRAERIVPLTAREREAERLTLEQVLGSKLELSWRDVDGREYVGLPDGFSRWSAYYDPSADAIREFPFGGRTLYEPRVRETRRKIDKPTDEAVASAGLVKHDGHDGPDASIDEAVAPAGLVKHDEPDGHDEPDESTDEAVASAGIVVKHDEPERHDEPIDLDESTDQWRLGRRIQHCVDPTAPSLDAFSWNANKSSIRRFSAFRWQRSARRLRKRASQTLATARSGARSAVNRT